MLSYVDGDTRKPAARVTLPESLLPGRPRRMTWIHGFGGRSSCRQRHILAATIRVDLAAGLGLNGRDRLRPRRVDFQLWDDEEDRVL